MARVTEARSAQILSGEGSEGGRFYRPGNPATLVYEVLGKNGKYRSPTVKDARANNWCVSVSEVIRQVAAPALERWRREQSVLAALTHPKVHEVTDAKQLLAMIEADAGEQARKAAERGTAIHKAIETFYSTGQVDDGYEQYINSVWETLTYLTGTVDDMPKAGRVWWKTETAATHPLGYGGRVDLYSAELGMVVDFKGKEFDADWKPVAYDEQARQLAAYSNLIFQDQWRSPPQQIRCVNLFISRNHPGLVKAYEWEPSDIERAWREFKCLLEFWRIRNGMV